MSYCLQKLQVPVAEEFAMFSFISVHCDSSVICIRKKTQRHRHVTFNSDRMVCFPLSI